jgi:hypothetical protein
MRHAFVFGKKTQIISTNNIAIGLVRVRKIRFQPTNKYAFVRPIMSSSVTPSCAVPQVPSRARYDFHPFRLAVGFRVQLWWIPSWSSVSTCGRLWSPALVDPLTELASSPSSALLLIGVARAGNVLVLPLHGTGARQYSTGKSKGNQLGVLRGSNKATCR